MHDVDIAIYLYLWNILITNRQNCMERELTLFDWIFICICIKLKFYWQLLLFTAGHLKLNFFFFIKNDAYYIIPVHVSFTFLFFAWNQTGAEATCLGRAREFHQEVYPDPLEEDDQHGPHIVQSVVHFLQAGLQTHQSPIYPQHPHQIWT